MAETTTEVRADIEQTRARMSDAISELERKVDLTQKVREHPWGAVGVAFGAGIALSVSRADVKAAKVTADYGNGVLSIQGSPGETSQLLVAAGNGSYTIEEQNSALQDKLDMIYAILAPDYEEPFPHEESEEAGGLVQIKSIESSGTK